MTEKSETGKLNQNLWILKRSGIDVPDKKYCVDCKEYLDLDKFNNHPTNSFGKQSMCRECFRTGHGTPDVVRKQSLKRRYGLTVEEYEELLKNQGDACGICGVTEEKTKGRVNWSVDHDHVTGKVRGLICYRCNSILGYANDEIELLEKMITYLQKYAE